MMRLLLTIINNWLQHAVYIVTSGTQLLVDLNYRYSTKLIEYKVRTDTYGTAELKPVCTVTNTLPGSQMGNISEPLIIIMGA